MDGLVEIGAKIGAAVESLRKLEEGIGKE